MNMSNPSSMGNSTSSSSGGMSTSMFMTPWLHFGTGDPILFSSWQPSSTGAVAGACIGLIVFSMLERCIAAFRRVQEVRWRARPSLSSSSKQAILAKEQGVCEASAACSEETEIVPPFSISRDVQRGAMQIVQSTMAYALMLIVMTYNGAYVISIILGVGIGEVLVGRIARQQGF